MVSWSLARCPSLKAIELWKMAIAKRGYLGGELLVCDVTRPILQSTHHRGEEAKEVREVSGGPPGMLFFLSIGWHSGSWPDTCRSYWFRIKDEVIDWSTRAGRRQAAERQCYEWSPMDVRRRFGLEILPKRYNQKDDGPDVWWSLSAHIFALWTKLAFENPCLSVHIYVCGLVLAMTDNSYAFC